MPFMAAERRPEYRLFIPEPSWRSHHHLRDQLKVFAFRYHLDPAVIHPHSFRHLFAKNFVERCDDIALLSDILGHESIETTRIYLHKNSTEQQALFNQIVIW